MRAPEFWVMRAILHQGPKSGPMRGQAVNIEDCTPGAFVAVLALVNTGDYCLLPDGTICEPVEVFTTQLDADAHRAKLSREMPREDFRVIMNVDVKL